MTELEDVHFLCPKALLEEFDEALKKGRYKGRTEALLELMRKFVDRRLAIQATTLQKRAEEV